jgi:dTDP-4-dehydrorhamnose reductase
MKKILVTGGSGLLGQYLNISLTRKFELFTIFWRNPGNCPDYDSARVNILDENELKIIFQGVNPDVVIHTAAITTPIQRENQSTKDYFDLNVTTTKNIASLCEAHNSKLIYISTDLVYAGYRGSFLREDAKLIPASLYAETKLVGENKVKEFTDNYLILRTALLYGFGLNHSKCHFHFMFDELRNKRPVKLFTDQFRTPISLQDATRTVVELAQMDVKSETINVGGTERVSRYEMGEMLCSTAGFDKNLLHKITMDDVTNFPKVEDVSLNTEKLSALGFKTRSIQENIIDIIRGN